MTGAVDFAPSLSQPLLISHCYRRHRAGEVWGKPARPYSLAPGAMEVALGDTTSTFMHGRSQPGEDQTARVQT